MGELDTHRRSTLYAFWISDFGFWNNRQPAHPLHAERTLYAFWILDFGFWNNRQRAHPHERTLHAPRSTLHALRTHARPPVAYSLHPGRYVRGVRGVYSLPPPLVFTPLRPYAPVPRSRTGRLGSSRSVQPCPARIRAGCGSNRILRTRTTGWLVELGASPASEAVSRSTLHARTLHASRDSAPRDSAPRDSAPRESAPRTHARTLRYAHPLHRRNGHHQ
jgi:hypothetical protein